MASPLAVSSRVPSPLADAERRLQVLPQSSAPRHHVATGAQRLNVYRAATSAASANPGVATQTVPSQTPAPVLPAPVPKAAAMAASRLPPARPSSTVSSDEINAAKMHGRGLYLASMLATAVGTATLGALGPLAAGALGLGGMTTLMASEVAFGRGAGAKHIIGCCIASVMVGLAMTALMPTSPWVVLGVTALSFGSDRLASAHGARRPAAIAAGGLPWGRVADGCFLAAILCVFVAPHTAPPAAIALAANMYGSASVSVRKSGEHRLAVAKNTFDVGLTAFETYVFLLTRGLFSGSAMPALLG